MFRAIDISTSGLAAQRQRMNAIAGNIANVNTTRGADGNPVPFQRRIVTFMAEEPQDGGGAAVTSRIELDPQNTPRRLYEPGHPDADADGYVTYPDIDLVTEFVNALGAGRAYEANVAAIEASKEMMTLGLKILA